MVQYILTPWRDRQELLLVRKQFYGTAGSDPQQQRRQSAKATCPFISTTSGPDTDRDRPSARGCDEQDDGVAAEHPDYAQHQYSHSPLSQAQASETHRHRQAVARVSMWMQRGNCPHMVESTALLTAAILSDDGLAGSAYAVRAAYSAAFSRFVTGLLDGHQDKQRKQSMYSVAKTIGLPATFVELRHQATHEQLPSLAKLRSAAKKALDWIWNYYWKHLAPENTAPKKEPCLCRDIVLGYLRGGEEDQTMRALEQFSKDKVLAVIADVQGSLPGNQAYLRCLKLSKDVMVRKETETIEEVERVEEMIEEQKAAASSGWNLYEGPWRPKPIGMV